MKKISEASHWLLQKSEEAKSKNSKGAEWLLEKQLEADIAADFGNDKLQRLQHAANQKQNENDIYKLLGMVAEDDKVIRKPH